MTGFADLVQQGQPALFGEGVTASATEGATWLWTFLDVTDGSGAAIDLSDVTGTCQVIETIGGALVTELNVTGDVGTFSISLDEADTAGLANGLDGRKCRWLLTLTDGTDVVQAWGLSKSSFTIYPGA